jgi:hypothetical protein
VAQSAGLHEARHEAREERTAGAIERSRPSASLNEGFEAVDGYRRCVETASDARRRASLFATQPIVAVEGGSRPGQPAVAEGSLRIGSRKEQTS